MDTFSWATKSPPRPVEELHSPVVQRLRSDELFFRKSFRHVNNDSDPADFSIHLFSESLIHIPGIFIQNLSERPIHIARESAYNLANGVTIVVEATKSETTSTDLSAFDILRELVRD